MKQEAGHHLHKAQNRARCYIFYNVLVYSSSMTSAPPGAVPALGAEVEGPATAASSCFFLREDFLMSLMTSLSGTSAGIRAQEPSSVAERTDSSESE